DRAPRGLRGMRREHRLDQQAIEQLLQLPETDARRLQPDQRVLEAARLVIAFPAQVSAAPADAMHLLRRADHLEVGRERADDLQREIEVEVAHEIGELLAGLLVAFPAADRAQARVLDEIEQAIAALLLQELADQRSQRAHVVA